MESFILKGNICYSVSKTKIRTISGYVVCKEGKSAAVILAHVKKGEGIETATQIYLASFYVDEDNMLTLVSEDDGMFLINK